MTTGSLLAAMYTNNPAHFLPPSHSKRSVFVSCLWPPSIGIHWKNPQPVDKKKSKVAPTTGFPSAVSGGSSNRLRLLNVSHVNGRADTAAKPNGPFTANKNALLARTKENECINEWKMPWFNWPLMFNYRHIWIPPAPPWNMATGTHFKVHFQWLKLETLIFGNYDSSVECRIVPCSL